MADGADDLTEAIEIDGVGHAVLWAVRAFVVGRGECAVVRRLFQDLCGPAADETLTTLFLAVKLLAFRSQRRLRIHLPGCRCVSGDELTLLAAVAAAREPTGGTGAAPLDRWLSRLSGTAPDSSLIRAFEAVGELLAAAGCEVSIGAPGDWQTRRGYGAPPGATLH